MTGLTDEQLEDAGRAFFRAIPIEWEPSRADYRAASLAFLATLPRIAGGVPAGWVLAPVKMTRQMAEAADRALIQMQSSQTIYAEALAASPPPPVKMLVDADWLRRKVETDPDGLDCEVGPPPPVSGEMETVSEATALAAFRHFMHGAKYPCGVSAMREVLERYASPPPGPSDWRPIERDHPAIDTIVDIWVPGRGRIADASRATLLGKSVWIAPTIGRGGEDSWLEEPVPTHFMDLPAPPTNGER